MYTLYTQNFKIFALIRKSKTDERIINYKSHKTCVLKELAFLNILIFHLLSRTHCKESAKHLLQVKVKQLARQRRVDRIKSLFLFFQATN